MKLLLITMLLSAMVMVFASDNRPDYNRGLDEAKFPRGNKKSGGNRKGNDKDRGDLRLGSSLGIDVGGGIPDYLFGSDILGGILDESRGPSNNFGGDQGGEGELQDGLFEGKSGGVLGDVLGADEELPNSLLGGKGGGVLEGLLGGKGGLLGRLLNGLLGQLLSPIFSLLKGAMNVILGLLKNLRGGVGINRFGELGFDDLLQQASGLLSDATTADNALTRRPTKRLTNPATYPVYPPFTDDDWTGPKRTPFYGSPSNDRNTN